MRGGLITDIFFHHSQNLYVLFHPNIISTEIIHHSMNLHVDIHMYLSTPIFIILFQHKSFCSSDKVAILTQRSPVALVHYDDEIPI